MDKIKVLLLSDSVRRYSGVAIQAFKLCKGLLKTGRYQIIQIAGGDDPGNPAPFYHDGIKIYPTSSPYGDPNILRHVIRLEHPDIVLAFSDPRFFTWLFSLDNEIRDTARLVYYHTWDNAPFPKFNLPYYAACDQVVTISHFSHNLLESGGVTNTCIPHGMDPSEFYPLDAQEVAYARKELIKASGAKIPVNFIVFWNNRNIERKRPGDMLYSFKLLSEKHPDSLLLLNTDLIDQDGIDIMHFIRDFNITAPIIFNSTKVDAKILNRMYNTADVTLNIAHSEGFGLSNAESLCAGTPVIATATGGLTEQSQTILHHDAVLPDATGKGRDAFDETLEFGYALPPDAKTLFGVVGAPYIFRDYPSIDTIATALCNAYLEVQHHTWKERIGEQARNHILQHYHIDTTVKLWDELLQKTMSTPSTYERWKVSVH